MGSENWLSFEELIARNEKFVFSILTYLVISVIYFNLSVVHSPLIGVIASVVFFLVNGIFLGHAFFHGEAFFFRLLFGILLLVAFLGLVSWVVMIVYNLDILRSAIALCIVTTLSTFMNWLETRRLNRRAK